MCKKINLNIRKLLLVKCNYISIPGSLGNVLIVSYSIFESQNTRICFYQRGVVFAVCTFSFWLLYCLPKYFLFFFIWNSVVYRFNDTLRLNVNKPLNSKSYLPYPLSPCSYAHSKHSHIDAFWYHHFTDYAVPVKALHIGGLNWRSNHVTNETF